MAMLMCGGSSCFWQIWQSSRQRTGRFQIRSHLAPPLGLTFKPPVPLDGKPTPHHRARQVHPTREALQHRPPIAIGIDLPALNRLSRRESAQMVAGGERVTGRALTPCTARSRHLRGVYGVKTIRPSLAAAADGVAVVVIDVRAGEEVRGRRSTSRHQPFPLRASDNPSAQRREHGKPADQGLVVGPHSILIFEVDMWRGRWVIISISSRSSFSAAIFDLSAIARTRRGRPSPR